MIFRISDMKTVRNIPAFFKSIHLWLPLTGCFLFFILLTTLNFVNTGHFSSNWNHPDLMRESWLIIVQMIFTMYFVYYVIQYFDKKFGIAFSIKRYVYEILFVVIVGFAINQFFHFLFVKFVVVPEENAEELEIKLHNLAIVSQVLILIIYILITGFRILKSLQQKKVEILKLQKEFTQTQFEALKNQLNPHFLFNSLSVLTSLIHADAEKAEIFIDKLARTYRYLLDQRDIEAVEISKEMEFLDHFQFLVFQRYGNKLVIEKEDSFASENYFLLPHTLLIVLEEIIGNNTMSFSRPLKIVVTIKNRFLFIRYSNQPKEIQKDKTENQFSALLENYRHISKEISILEDDYFQQKTIRIPLITA